MSRAHQIGRHAAPMRPSSTGKKNKINKKNTKKETKKKKNPHNPASSVGTFLSMVETKEKNWERDGGAMTQVPTAFLMTVFTHQIVSITHGPLNRATTGDARTQPPPDRDDGRPRARR